MRIALDLSAVRTTGTKVYCSGFMPALGRLAQNDEFLVFMSQEIADMIGSQLPSNFRQQITMLADKPGLRVLWEQFVLPIYLQKWKAEVVFAPFDIAPFVSPCPVLLAARNPTPVLITTHLVNLARAEWLKGQLHRFLTYLSCKRAQLVCYPSFYASRALGDTVNVPTAKRAVVYHGVDHRIWSTILESGSVLKQYGIESQRYIFFASQLLSYKQPDVLIEGFANWTKMTGRREYKLVLVGRAPDKVTDRTLRQRACDLGVQHATLFLGEVPRYHMPVLYQQATAFVFPTIMETFGLPFVEAMASGVPVICADTEFAREICDGVALYFPPGDAHALAHALEMVVAQPLIRKQMMEQGRDQAAVFSWEREASETLALLKRVASVGFRPREQR